MGSARDAHANQSAPTIEILQRSCDCVVATKRWPGAAGTDSRLTIAFAPVGG
jgi:hypothetical protein